MTEPLSLKLGSASVLIGKCEKSYSEQHKTAHELLNTLYRSLYGEEPPETAKTSEGKPYFVSRPDVYISITHSDIYCAAAISDRPIGIDIERIRTYNKKIAVRWLRDFFDTSDESGESFTRAWTRLECVIKLRGRGLSERITQAEYDAVIFHEYNSIDGCILTLAEQKIALQK